MHLVIARSLPIFAMVCIVWAAVVDDSFVVERICYAISGLGAAAAFLAYTFNKPKLCAGISIPTAVWYCTFVSSAVSRKLITGEWGELAHVIGLAYTGPTLVGWGLTKTLFFRFDLVFFQVLGTAYVLAILGYSVTVLAGPVFQKRHVH